MLAHERGANNRKRLVPVLAVGVRQSDILVGSAGVRPREGTVEANVDGYTRDMVIKDVLTSHAGVARVFASHGLGCAACMAAEMETLASVAVMHDISVDVLIADLDALLEEEGGEES
jgi:hybrid cluster-associated redox disulfide protein